jgi:hypothetical protein
MLGVFVLRQITQPSGFIVTLGTVIPHTFMLGLLVYDQTTLCSTFVVTLALIVYDQK